VNNSSCRIVRSSTTAILAALLCAPLTVFAQWTFLDGAKVHPDFHGQVPRKSDVIFSTRFKRDNAPDVARAYGATRIEWCYSTDPAFIQTLKMAAPWFGGTLSSTLALPGDEGIALDLKGRPIVAPWMKSWGAKWISAANPATRQFLDAMVQRLLDLGVSSIQVDDPLLQYASTNWGGDFSVGALEGFRRFLVDYPNKAVLRSAGIHDPETLDYKRYLEKAYNIQTAKEYAERFRNLPTTPLWLEYHKEAVVSHYSRLKSLLGSMKGKAVPLSMNLALMGPDGTKAQFDLVPFVDYAMVETRMDDFDLVLLQAATYRALGVGYVPSILPATKAENRLAIASLYAMGAQPLVPWDVYVNNGPDKLPTRFFGTPEDYGDLYRFVKDNANFLDNLDELAVVGIVVPVNSYQPKETLDFVRRLSMAKIPFAVLPLGGKGGRYALNPKRANRFRLLATVNPLADFSPDDRAALRGLSVELRSAVDISDEMLRSISPYRFSRDSATRLIARANSQQPSNLVLHVIRPNRYDRSDAVSSCERSIAFQANVLGPGLLKTAQWRTPRHAVDLQLVVSDLGVMVELPDCDEWGTVVIRVTNQS